MTWNDYNAIPGPDYSDPSIRPRSRRGRLALVVTDFPDKTFALTKPQGSTVFGQPGPRAHDIPRADVPAFLRRLPEHAEHAQPLPDHEPVLDGGHATASTASSSTPTGRTRCPASRGSTSRRTSAGQRDRLGLRHAGRHAVQQELPHRRPRRLGGGDGSSTTSEPATTTSSTSAPARTRAGPGRSSGR